MTLTRELVYGRNATRELYRGPREVLETWVTERAGNQTPWLDAGPRPQVKPERILTEAAGTRDHQGIVAWCEPFRYADAYELVKQENPCSSASTRSPIRTTSERSRGARREREPPPSSSPRTARLG
jgi:tRNA G18 (ribose-2'-O)-methylase SpoU